MSIIKNGAGIAYDSANRMFVEGQVLHDAVASGAVFRMGAKAVNVAPLTVSATGDATEITATMVGALIQKPYAIPEADWQFACAAPVAVATDVVVKAAGAAGVRNYVTCIQLINTNAVASEVVLKDGAVVIWRGFVGASMVSMVDVQFITPLRGTAATALNFQAITAAASIYVNVQGYVAP